MNKTPIFVINLKNDTKKNVHMQNLCTKYDISLARKERYYYDLHYHGILVVLQKCSNEIGSTVRIRTKLMKIKHHISRFYA